MIKERGNASIKNVYSDGFSKQNSLTGNPRLLKVEKILGSMASKRFFHNNELRILDVGCGDGYFTLRMQDALNRKVILHGVDISVHAVQLASNAGVNALQADTDEGVLPYPNDYFDIVYCGSLIEVVLNPDRLIDEISRVTNQSGIMIFTYPNLGAWLSRVAVLFGRMPFYSRLSRQYDFGKLLIPPSLGASTGFIRLFTSNAFIKFINIKNLKIVSIHGAREKSLPKFFWPLDGLFSIFPGMAFQNIAVLQK